MSSYKYEDKPELYSTQSLAFFQVQRRLEGQRQSSIVVNPILCQLYWIQAGSNPDLIRI